MLLNEMYLIKRTHYLFVKHHFRTKEKFVYWFLTTCFSDCLYYCRNRGTLRCSFYLLLLRVHVRAAVDLMTAKRLLLVRSVCVWEEGMAVSQSSFGAQRRDNALPVILSFPLS